MKITSENNGYEGSTPARIFSPPLAAGRRLAGRFMLGSALLGAGWGVQLCQAGTGFPVAAADEQSFSIGVVQLTVDPAFAFLFAPDIPAGPPYYYYPGFSPASGVLTSPTMYDFSDTWIGVSAKHVRNVGAPAYFPAIVGTPAMLPPPHNSVAGYADYVAIPPAIDTMADGVDEVVTEIESIKLSVGSSAGQLQCPRDPRVPTLPPGPPLTIVRAGNLMIPSLPLNRRSLGLVQQLPGNPPGPTDDFPAQSFFDIFVEINLPYVPGNNSLHFPPSNPPGWDPGAVLYNDANNPLIIANPNVTTLPPTAVYIHGQSAAVPVKFRFANPPYWAADDVLGYVVLAGHGVFPGAETNACDKAEFVLDETLGPVGSSKPQMPIPWLRQSTSFPTPSAGYGSLVNRVVDGTGTAILDDKVVFSNGLASVISLRDLNLGNLINPITPPPLGSDTLYSFTGPVSTSEMSPDGLNWGTGSATGPVQIHIAHTSNTGSAAFFDTEILQLDLTGNNSLIGPFMIRESPTKQSLGKHTIQQDPRGFRVSSFFDVFLELSVNDGLDWIPATRSLRVTPSAPPAAPNSIFISRAGSKVVLNWQNEFTLQSAATVNGPYTDVPGPILTGPYTNTPAANQQYFRLRQ